MKFKFAAILFLYAAVQAKAHGSHPESESSSKSQSALREQHDGNSQITVHSNPPQLPSLLPAHSQEPKDQYANLLDKLYQEYQNQQSQSSHEERHSQGHGQHEPSSCEKNNLRSEEDGHECKKNKKEQNEVPLPQSLPSTQSQKNMIKSKISILGAVRRPANV